MNSWRSWSGNNIFSSDAAIIRFSGSYTRQNGPNEPLNQEDIIHEDFEYEIWPSGHRRRPHPVRHGVHEPRCVCRCATIASNPAYSARYTVKGLLGKQVLYTASVKDQVLTLSVPEDVATFRATVGEMRKLMDNGVRTVVLTTNKASTTLNLSLLCEGQRDTTKVTLRHISSSAVLHVGLRCRRWCCGSWATALS